MISRDGLAASLRQGHREIILEADEWRPLADRILDLSRLGHLGPTDREVRMQAVLREIEFGNRAHDDCCPLCGNVRKRGHLDWCRIAKALEP